MLIPTKINISKNLFAFSCPQLINFITNKTRKYQKLKFSTQSINFLSHFFFLHQIRLKLLHFKNQGLGLVAR